MAHCFEITLQHGQQITFCAALKHFRDEKTAGCQNFASKMDGEFGKADDFQMVRLFMTCRIGRHIGHDAVSLAAATREFAGRSKPGAEGNLEPLGSRRGGSEKGNAVAPQSIEQATCVVLRGVNFDFNKATKCRFYATACDVLGFGYCLSCTVFFKPFPGIAAGLKRKLGDQTCHLVSQMPIDHIIIAMIDPTLTRGENDTAHHWFQTNFDYLLEYVPPRNDKGAETSTSRVELDSHEKSSEAAPIHVNLVANQTWRCVEAFLEKIDDLPYIWLKRCYRTFLSNVRDNLGTSAEQRTYDNDALVFGVDITFHRHLPITWHQRFVHKDTKDNKALRIPIWRQTMRIVQAMETHHGVLPATCGGEHKVYNLDFPNNPVDNTGMKSHNLAVHL